jgi:hypothetical protein
MFALLHSLAMFVIDFFKSPRDGTFDLCERTEEIVERTQVMGAAYFDIRFNAKAHSLPASHSPSLASPIITLAIAIVAKHCPS